VALQSHAGTAKQAIDAFTRHCAVEWGPYNINVNTIKPGAISDTLGFNKLNPDNSNMSFDLIPLQRAGFKVEIAGVVL